jgi:putative ABC transport system ATP-binding protein
MVERAHALAPAGGAGAGQEAYVARAIDVTRVFHVGYEPVHALRGVTLAVRPSEFVALKGRSGSGKTTLLNLLGALDTPTTGEVYLLGRQISLLPEAERTRLRRTSVGFAFQAFSLMPTSSALENVELPLRIARWPAAERRERALACLTVVGLRQWAEHRPFEMSGGQQQRLSIARGLAQHPSVLIADEPTGTLDSETGHRIMELLVQLVAQEGLSIIMASHDPMVDQYASRTYYLDDGRLLS